VCSFRELRGLDFSEGDLQELKGLLQKIVSRHVESSEKIVLPKRA